MEIALDDTCEQELIRRVRAGEASAFGELVERHKRRAYFAALGLVGCPDDALELSQDAFVRAFRARTSLDPERPFYAWLYQILRRLCFNFNRDRKLHRERLAEARGWLDATVEDDDPEQRLQREQLRTRVREGIEALADREREILVLKEFEGLRYREIAELLDIPLGTVMSRLYAARRSLARVMEERS